MGVDERVEVEDEDDLEGEARPTKAEAPTQAGNFTCPECREVFKTPEDLGVHLERHSPTDIQPTVVSSRRGIRMITIPCPKGCGRHFIRRRTDGGNGTTDLNNHAKICDGSSPIVGAREPEEETGKLPKEDSVATKFVCPECGEKFDVAQALGAHRRHKHPGAAAARKPTPSPRAKALAKRLRADRDEPEERKEDDTTPVPLVVVDKDLASTLPIQQRVLDLPELEHDRLAKELGKTKSLIAAVRNAVPEEKSEGEARPTAEE